MNLDADEIKRHAAGRCVQILQSVCGLTDQQLNPRIHQPCPDCGGTDRFRAFDDVNETGGLLCNQCGKRSDLFASIQWLRRCTFPEALKLVADAIGIASTSQGSGHHRPATALERKPVKLIEPHFLKYLEAKGRDELPLLAERLTVSVDSLQALGAGFNPEENVWTFPERTADGEVPGICRRFQDGQKKMMHGHKHGLYFSDNWLQGVGPILIVEGLSDTAAAITKGLAAIGRPSAIVPRDVLPELVELLKRVPKERGIIVVGENDQDHMQDHMPWPGKEGAIKTAQQLTEALGRPIPWALPPATTKDLRSWLKSNPEATGHDFLDSLTIEQPAADQPGDEAPGIDFEIIDSKTFAETEYKTDFLIDGVMTVGQPQLGSGAFKTMKTSVLVDQMLSLAAKVPFLGRFEVPKAKRCLLLSSESGCATLKETAVRICEAKGINLADLGDQLHWGFRPPQLNAPDHIATLEKIILRERIDVVAIDPAYLSMNLAGNEASNQFAVGAILMNLTRLQADTGVTPILVTHFRMHMPVGQMPTLEHVAGAGFGQWARQWILLNRREAFNDENPGNHQLLMSFGGSAGHAGAYALDIQEGTIQEGRVWNVTVSHLSAIREQKESEREDRKRDQESRTYENHRAAILRVLKRYPNGETKTQIRLGTSLSSRYFEPVWQDLISCQEIEACRFDRLEELKADGTPKNYAGFRMVDPASRLSKDTRTLKDTEGHCPAVSGRT